ncbi:selenoneine biosynthesis selenosugar synthase SenB [Noviherbaspirillum galbum]|nr:selenoneine biosynthesis selenosugar synthase SenB [Noviherbaspirillum galbum]
MISPATASANNGNWQTVSRWARFLSPRYDVSIMQAWDGCRADAMIALHARRSAGSLQAFAMSCPNRPAVLVLTGTDLYRDIHADASARDSIVAATALVVLQESGLGELPPALRAKAKVIFQSAPALPALPARDGQFDVIMVGHLRAEKDPATYMAAARLVSDPRVRMLHVGGALDASLDSLARDTMRDTPRYQWLGNLPHDETRRRVQACRLMVLTSRMEGGANVIIEAVTSGVPVLASDISGNCGMLGEAYAGYFPVGDGAALARMIDRAARDAAWLEELAAQCRERARLFTPEAERAAVLQLMDNLGCRAS